MQNFIKSMEELPLIVKIILAIPALDIIWAVYRIARSALKNNMLGIIFGILLIVPGAAITWLVDIICLVFTGKILWID